MPHVQQKAVIVGNAFQFAFDGAVELGSIGGRVVAKATVLEPAPNLLQGIQHRRVGRQFFQMQPGFETFDGFTNGIPLVHHPAIPNHNDSFRNLAHQHLQERRRTLFVVVGVYQSLEEESQWLSTPRRPPERPCNRDLLSMFSALPQDRSMSSRSPSPTNKGGHQKATFIDKNHARTFRVRFFLIRFQSVWIHAAIASSFRSRGTRSGFWQEKPRTLSQRGKYRALKATLHSCRMSLPGRPHGASATSPDHPWRRKTRTQRRTLLTSTPRKSATSSEENPSRTRCTANRRRCSS